jgi:4a-hydroxytetrahydrobiopterin dehydratase
MDMLSGTQISAAGLVDWRKLGQGLHPRFLIDDFTTGVRFLTAVGETGADVGDHLTVRMDGAHLDLKLISDDAIYRGDAGVEHRVEWVTEADVELARRISAVAAEHSIAADPASVTAMELVLDTADAAAVAPVWSALLTGGSDAQGRGTIGDDSQAPRATVLADPDGNKACVDAFQPLVSEGPLG